jgi:hypothetical protein
MDAASAWLSRLRREVDRHGYGALLVPSGRVAAVQTRRGGGAFVAALLEAVDEHPLVALLVSAKSGFLVGRLSRP